MILSSLVKFVVDLFDDLADRAEAVPDDAALDAKLLAKRDASEPEKRKLNVIDSIVDVLKLFDLPSDLRARRELRGELGLTGPYSGTAEENVNLMKAFRSHLKKGEIWRARKA